MVEPVKSCLLALGPRAAPLGLEAGFLLTQPRSVARIVTILSYLGPLTTLLVPLGVAAPGLPIATGLATVAAVDVAASATYMSV